MLKVPFIRFYTLGTRLAYNVRNVATEVVSNESDDFLVQEEDIVQKELAIEKKRNKSGLSAPHFNLMHGRVPYEEPKHKIHYTARYQRRQFAKFGSDSNVDPRICWMDKDELLDRLEYEKLAEDKSIPEMIQMAKEEKLSKQKAIAEREALLELKISKIAQWEKDLKMRQEKSLAVANAAKEKKERLIEEVRRHFGFKVDPRDERFQEMLAEKEKQQKKAEKLAKKSAKEAKMLAQLQQKNAEILAS